MSLVLSLSDVRKEPFHYGLFRSVFSAAAHAALLKWLEEAYSWKLVQTEFYEQYEFCVDDVSLPETEQFLKDPTLREELCLAMEKLFNVELYQDIHVLAHKLVPSQHIGIHNDVIERGESHRLTVQVNRGLPESYGGYFMLFNTADVRDMHRILKPLTNTAVAFAISEQSHHAVSKQHGGTRFTLVFSFYEFSAWLT